MVQFEVLINRISFILREKLFFEDRLVMDFFNESWIPDCEGMPVFERKRKGTLLLCFIDLTLFASWWY